MQKNKIYTILIIIGFILVFYFLFFAGRKNQELRILNFPELVLYEPVFSATVSIGGTAPLSAYHWTGMPENSAYTIQFDST